MPEKNDAKWFASVGEVRAQDIQNILRFTAQTDDGHRDRYVSTSSCMTPVIFCSFSPDMGRCKITRGRQALELRSNLSERRSLTDRIQMSDHCSASYSARNLQWAVAHGRLLISSISIDCILKEYFTEVCFLTVLPRSLCLQFDCGVKVQLGFAAEFSNVMVIYTRILEKPNEIVSCCAQLIDFPEVC